MTEQNNTIDSPGSRTDIPQATPGVMLRSARETAGLSDQDIANHLCISLLRVQALEADQYENLSAQTFVLGYIRAYSRAVNLEPSVVIDAYYQYMGQLHKTTEKITKNVGSGGQSDPETAASVFWQKPSVWIGGLLLVWLILFTLFSDDPQTTDVLLKEAPAVEPEVEILAGAGDSPMDAVSEAVAESVTTQASVAENTAEEAATSVSKAPQEGEMVEPAVVSQSLTERVTGNLDVLVMTFSDECWLEVTDSRGDVLSADLQQNGDRVVLEGIAPFDIMLGNVRAVNVTLNDEVVELKPRGFRKTLRTQIAAP